MILDQPINTNVLRDAITSAYRQNEEDAVSNLLEEATIPEKSKQRIQQTAKKLVEGTRKARNKQGSLDTFLHEYDLSSAEGIALMCLAEALLRIPDNATIDRLINDKISSKDWMEHFNRERSLFINAATWGLMLTGKIYAPKFSASESLGATLKRLFSRTSSTVLRPIILQGMKIIGKQFVMGRTIEEALARAKETEKMGYRYSFDCLGEAARTAQDADTYFNSYQTAINALGKVANGLGPIKGPGISIKLSALHPRYEFAQRERVMQELVPRLLSLVNLAKEYNIGLTIDAEEADRLDLSLDIIETICLDASLKEFEGFGLAVQSYQKRAPFVLDFLADLAKRSKHRLMVRLIKGAYWDAEIKISQVLGLEGYPVFTRKNSTDVSFIACAKKILNYGELFYPQFGTHNAYSVATILELTDAHKDYEFQCLHGMGRPLYDQIVSEKIPCRIYAPVGSHKDLLGYLVRRLLENGANTSFINRLADANAPIENIIADPVARVSKLQHKSHPHIPLPIDLYGTERKNSMGIDLSNIQVVNRLKKLTEKIQNENNFLAGPILSGKLQTKSSELKPIVSPMNTNHVVGKACEASSQDIQEALRVCESSQWGNLTLEERSRIFKRAAEIFEKNYELLITLLTLEGGKQIADCVSEIRETVDYCRYYAKCALNELAPKELQGPTGEFNQLSYHPHGIAVCISPWNFPLAIFTGQIIAALVSGNKVIAKPAEQTPLIATEAVRILHEAGVHQDALQLLPGKGETIGANLIADERVSLVMFTGGTDTAKIIQEILTKRQGPIIPFIAETGGQNAMIVDSSALPEQVVVDVIHSAFNSAGQRCSALRVLFVQEDIAERLLTMLQGAMAELTIGDPSLLATDIGPVIDQDALQMLRAHFLKMNKEAKLLYQVPLPKLPHGHYFAPCMFELENLKQLTHEVFGPILHVIRYHRDELDNVLSQIYNTGYGLTLGIHSRIESTVKYIREHTEVGNIYVNRNMIGAVVGVQPFGGERLSGTGPKAGGPNYLPRLCVERSISVNTTAAGGNATLLSLGDE